MKVCENCGSENVGQDGENLCKKCDACNGDRKQLANRRQSTKRRKRDQVLRDCGLVRVRGALGGVYWE